VSRMTLRSALVAAAAVLASSSVHAQILPQDSLNHATQLVGTLGVSQSTAGERIAKLKQDYTDFLSAYLAAQSPVGGAVGTTGRSDDVRPDWRARYQRVEADLAALLGAPDATAQPPDVVLDPETRTRLESVRAELRTFYAGTLGQADGNPVAHTGVSRTPDGSAASRPPVAPTGEAPQTTRPDSQAPVATAPAPPPSTGAASIADSEMGTALALLDRIQRILDDATKETGKLTLDRGAIDEIRAEVAQVQAILRKPH
jgi:hypothetical protein